MKLPVEQFCIWPRALPRCRPAAHCKAAQTYPTRPITVVVGAAAGGPTDTIGRIITERMRNALGQTIVIENNGAAAGNIALLPNWTLSCCGYTLSLGHWGTHVVNGAVYALTYNTLNGYFEPIALISVSSYFMVRNNDLPPESISRVSSHG